MKRPHEIYMIWPKEKYIFHQDVISLAQTSYQDLEFQDPGFHVSHEIDFPINLEESILYLRDMDLAYFRVTPRRERMLGKFRKGI